jgi:hypothetical protein
MTATYCGQCDLGLVYGLGDEVSACPNCNPSSNGHEPDEELSVSDPEAKREPNVAVVPLEDFVAVEEPGAEPLVGSVADNLIPEGGDIMVYGDGGAGKTTLTVDLAFHLATGTDWLGFNVPRPAKVLLIENEGPRPLFRTKLRDKTNGWSGNATNGNLRVLERPWASFTFDNQAWRDKLVQLVREHEIDAIIAGPLVRIGMDAAGTLQEVVKFMRLVKEVRERTGRPLTVFLVHHENKGGQVSGAWEGAGDTLVHVGAAGNGRTILYIQKARWASASHHRTLKLEWTDGQGFAREDDRDTLAEVKELLADLKPRTSREIATELGVGRETVEKTINENPSEFVGPITDDEAKRLGRNANAKLWGLA